MARTKISEFSATPGDNTDIDGIDIAEGCAPSGINNAIRELMAQLKDMQTGASGDTFTLTTVNSTTVDTTNLEVTNLKAKDGTSAGSIANSTGVVTLGSSVLTTTDINGGTIDGTTIGASTPSTVVATQVDITAQGDLRLQDSTGGEYVALQAPATLSSSYTLTLPVDDGTSGQALITDGSGVLSWSSAASGDVYGPASATDNAVARYDGTTGKIIQNSAVTIADDGATVIAANSSSDGLRITQIGAGNALLVEDSANPDATPTVIDASGRFVIGATSAQSTYQWFGTTYRSPYFQNYSTDGNLPAWSTITNYTNDESSSILSVAKSRGTSVGTNTIVQANDNLGSLYFQGADGTNFISAARVTAEVDGTPGTNDMPGRLVFSTTADGASSPTERMRITNAGNMGIGATPSAEVSFIVGKNVTGATTSYGIAESGTVQSDVTVAANMFLSNPKTAATAFTLGNLFHFNAAQGTKGAGSTITNQFGFYVDANCIGATNNYGFYGNIGAASGRWNFYAAGTAANYFAGNVGIKSVTPAAGLEVASDVFFGSANNVVTGAVSIQGKTTANWNFAGLNLIRNAANTGSPRFIGLPLDGDDLASTTIGGYNAIWGIYNASPTTGSTSVALQGEMAYASFYGHRWYINGTERMRIGSTGIISLGAAPGSESLRVTPVASAVNYVSVQGNTTNAPPAIFVQGSDTNIDLLYSSKGTYAHKFYTNNFASQQFNVAHTASAVNYLQVTGSATGGGTVFSSQGSDSNININYWAKGTGSHIFATAGYAVQFVVNNTTSAVNTINVTGSTSGNAPSFYITGSDTNIDLALTPKGTGVLQFGTYTAGVVTQAGYITVKDAAGNTRRLLVG